MKIMQTFGAIFSVIAAAGVAAAPAHAQQFDIARAGMQIYESCKAVSSGQIAGDLRTSCACLVGYYGGILSDRDLALADILLRAGVMVERGASQDEITAEIGPDIQAGAYSEADINRVAAVVEQAGPRIDQVCAGFQQPGVSV